MAVVDEAKLRYLDFLSREDRVRHHRYVEEMKQYDMMRSGDINAIAESTRLWDSGLYGYLSDDPLKNAKYRFVTTITLATRFAIEGGMDEEDAYNASDLYIQNLENCKTPDDVRRLHTDMMTFFTWAMADMQKAETHSKAVNECLDYIHYHLHEKITVPTPRRACASESHVSVGAVQTRNGHGHIAIHHRQAYGSGREHAQILGIQLRRDRPDPRIPVAKPFLEGVQKTFRHDAGGVPHQVRAERHLAGVIAITASTTPVAVNRR